MNKTIPTEDKHTSEFWHNFYVLMSSQVIIDPDGWDRKHYQKSWFEEKITWDEFQQRLIKSTVMHADLLSKYKLYMAISKCNGAWYE